MELTLFALTCLGFVVFRSEAAQRLVPWIWNLLFKSGNIKYNSNAAHAKAYGTDYLPVKELEANFAAGQFEAVLDTWATLKRLSVSALAAVVQSLLATQRLAEVPKAVRQALAAHQALCTTEALHAVLEVMPLAKAPLDCPAEVCIVFADAGVLPTDATLECLLPAMRRVEPPQALRFLTQIYKGATLPSRAYEILIRAAAKSKQLEHALEYVRRMCRSGHDVPASCLTPVLVLAASEGALSNVLLKLPSGVKMSPESLGSIMDHAVKVPDMGLLKSMHEKAIGEGIPLTATSYEALVRGYASIGDVRAIRLFEEMLGRGFELSENSLVGLISACAEAKHVQMAERVVTHCRQKKGQLSLAIYSSLMKVYSHARIFHKACDLHELMLKDGVRPDTVAYGCLIRAAVESGRVDLAQKLFKESGNPDLLNYMSLIRAAGRERNLPKALGLLKDLEQSPIPIDTTAYNCVLDVCVACGDQSAAKTLFKHMQEKDRVDVISYNTFLKALLAKTNGAPCSSASEVALILQEMRSRNLKPNAVTYNSLINAAVSRGDLTGAWQYVDDMESQGVALDAFTCSILMKGVKHSSRKEEVERILGLIERAKVVPDEVLINSLLDACVRLRNGQLLTLVLERFRATGVVPSLHAYATLIKAYGHAQQLDQVWALWRELTTDRKTTPNEEVFACMADACVANGDLNGAVHVLRQMKQLAPDHPGNPAVFSGLLKACLQRKELQRAMELYEEMDRSESSCSLTTYNMLIDAFARAGNMDRVARLFKDMYQKNINPDIVTYSTVIKGYCVKGDLEPALQLFSLMRKRGIKPDAILFNSILDGCAHKQMRTLTEQVLGDMEEEGVKPSNFTLSILVKLYGRCGDLEKAFEVVETYPKRFSFDLNAQVYTCLMSACISNGQLDRALSVLEQMKQANCGADAKTYQTLLTGCLKHDNLEGAVRLVDDAMGFDGQRSGPIIMLEKESIENVLFIISKNGRASDLGDPLAERLRQAGITLSDRATSSLRGRVGAAPSRFHAARRGERTIARRDSPPGLAEVEGCN